MLSHLVIGFENLTPAELKAAKKLATDYGKGALEGIERLVERGYLLEICK